ncbi:hypothetical protein ABIF66_011939 [Bradyrhizobium japonicum]
MATISGKTFWCLCSAVLILAAAPARAEQRLFESVQATPAGEYTSGIEGPAADLDGNLYVVNFGKQGAIGPAGHFKFLRVWSVKFLHPRGRTRDC